MSKPVTIAQVNAMKLLVNDPPADFESFMEPLLKYLELKTAPQPKLPTRPATYFKSVREAARALDINHLESPEYEYKLKETTYNEPKELSPHFNAVVKELKTSDYVGTWNDESLSRTILDLILVDRLRHLEDKDAYSRLLLSAEVNISVKAEVDWEPEIIQGRADWALGYGETKSNTGSILIVVEAKKCGSASVGMPQMLVYMAGVQKARVGHTNTSVFGMLSDSTLFEFAFLDSDKKFYTSSPLRWTSSQKVILSYIDTMLLDAIQSSPHTTPKKVQNNILHNYRRYSHNKWAFGEDFEDEAEGDTKMDEDVFVDVVNREF